MNRSPRRTRAVPRNKPLNTPIFHATQGIISMSANRIVKRRQWRSDHPPHFTHTIWVPGTGRVKREARVTWQEWESDRAKAQHADLVKHSYRDIFGLRTFDQEL